MNTVSPPAETRTLDHKDKDGKGESKELKLEPVSEHDKPAAAGAAAGDAGNGTAAGPTPATGAVAEHKLEQAKHEVKHDDEKNMVFFGCQIVEGRGKVRVLLCCVFAARCWFLSVVAALTVSVCSLLSKLTFALVLALLVALGQGVVIKTGMKTKMGEIQHLLNTADDKASPLEERLDVLGERLGQLAAAAAVN